MFLRFSKLSCELQELSGEPDSGLTDGVGRQARRMASELECRGVYLGSCRMGCMLNGCLLFIDIMIAEVREGRCASSSFGSVLVTFSEETPRGETAATRRLSGRKVAVMEGSGAGGLAF